MAEYTKSQNNLSDVWLELRRIGKEVERIEADLRAHVRPATNGALSTKEAAKLLGISPRTLRRHASLGHIRPVRNGGRITYTRQALEAFQRDAALGKVSVPVGRASK